MEVPKEELTINSQPLKKPKKPKAAGSLKHGVRVAFG